MLAGLTRRRFLKTAGALGIVPAIGPKAVHAASDLSQDLSGVTLRVAYYKGLHKTLLETAGLADTPYRVDWKEFNSGVQHIEGINADALDFGSGSEISAAFAAKSGAAVKFIAVYKEDLNNQGTFVQKDAPIKTVADLRGKRVGYVRGTTSQYYLYKQLAEAGLSFDDIRAANLSPTDGLIAFARGDLDAWAIWGYNGQIARTKYGAGTLKTGVGYLSGNFLISANPKAINDPKRHAALADFLQRLKKAYAWSNLNYPTYAAAQSQAIGVPVEDILELFNRRSQDYSLVANSDAAVASHQEVADVFTKIGVFDKSVDVKPYWDRSFDQLLA